MRTAHAFLLISCVFFGAIPSSPASATTLTVISQGAWHCCSLGLRPFGHFTGWFSWEENRSYFIFEIASLSAPVTSATLRLFNATDGFYSADSTETLTLFDVTTNLFTLATTTPGFSAFVDLGTGTSFGSVTVSEADENEWVEIALNADGLASLNTRIAEGRQRFALGAALTTLLEGPDSEYIFGFSGELAQLVTVPEPGQGLLLLVSLGALAARGRRRLRA